MRTPRIRFSSHSIYSFMLQWLVKAIKNRSEKYFGKLFKIADPLSLFWRILKFWIKVNEIISILPMLVKKLYAHDIFWLRLRWIFTAKISQLIFWYLRTSRGVGPTGFFRLIKRLFYNLCSIWGDIYHKCSL